MKNIAAYIYAVLILLTAVFQLALAAGAPWGSYAMGGAYPGVFPLPLRIAAIFQAALLLCFAAVVLAQAGVAFRKLQSISRWAIWVVVGFSIVALILNTITPSVLERMIWAPAALVMLVCSIRIALVKQ